MRARRALAALTLCGAFAWTLTACGIESTEVIEVGQPATGAKRPGMPVKEARLYFGFPGGGVLGVSRPAGDEVTAEEAIPLLLEGPNEAERMRGLYSEMPRLPKKDSRVDVVTSHGRVTIQMPVDPTRISPVARRQLVCTAAHNSVPGNLPADEVKVDLAGAGRTMTDQICDNNYMAPGTVPQAAPTSP